MSHAVRTRLSNRCTPDRSIRTREELSCLHHLRCREVRSLPSGTLEVEDVTNNVLRCSRTRSRDCSCRVAAEKRILKFPGPPRHEGQDTLFSCAESAVQRMPAPDRGTGRGRPHRCHWIGRRRHHEARRAAPGPRRPPRGPTRRPRPARPGRAPTRRPRPARPARARAPERG